MKILKKNLSKESYHVLAEKGTEKPFSGKYVDNKKSGVYTCINCGNILFDAKTKFDSGTGWPSFDEPKNLKNITLHKDYELGIPRIEVRCAKCDGHLGHVFNDGPTKTGKRFCINSCALEFKKK